MIQRVVIWGGNEENLLNCMHATVTNKTEIILRSFGKDDGIYKQRKRIDCHIEYQAWMSCWPDNFHVAVVTLKLDYWNDDLLRKFFFSHTCEKTI